MIISFDNVKSWWIIFKLKTITIDTRILCDKNARIFFFFPRLTPHVNAIKVSHLEANTNRSQWNVDKSAIIQRRNSVIVVGSFTFAIVVTRGSSTDSIIGIQNELSDEIADDGARQICIRRHALKTRWQISP